MASGSASVQPASGHRPGWPASTSWRLTAAWGCGINKGRSVLRTPQAWLAIPSCGREYDSKHCPTHVLRSGTNPLLGTFFTASTVAPVFEHKNDAKGSGRFSKPVGSSDKDQEQYNVSRALLANCAYALLCSGDTTFMSCLSLSVTFLNAVMDLPFQGTCFGPVKTLFWGVPHLQK